MALSARTSHRLLDQLTRTSLPDTLSETMSTPMDAAFKAADGLVFSEDEYEEREPMTPLNTLPNMSIKPISEASSTTTQLAAYVEIMRDVPAPRFFELAMASGVPNPFNFLEGGNCQLYTTKPNSDDTVHLVKLVVLPKRAKIADIKTTAVGDLYCLFTPLGKAAT
eukprot:50019-Amphidinium_carterae.2